MPFRLHYILCKQNRLNERYKLPRYAQLILATIISTACSSQEQSEWKRFCLELGWSGCSSKISLFRIKDEIRKRVQNHQRLDHAVATYNTEVSRSVSHGDLQHIALSPAEDLTKRFSIDFFDGQMKVSRLSIAPPFCVSKSERGECTKSTIRAFGAEVKVDQQTGAGRRLLRDVVDHRERLVCGASVRGHLRLVQRRDEQGNSLGRVGWWVVDNYSPELCTQDSLTSAVVDELALDAYRRITTSHRSPSELPTSWKGWLENEIEAHLSSPKPLAGSSSR